jgi:hypothetical protein
LHEICGRTGLLGDGTGRTKGNVTPSSTENSDWARRQLQLNGVVVKTTSSCGMGGELLATSVAGIP